MRILHVTPGLAWACGASRQLCNISRELTRMGHQVDIAYFFGQVPDGMKPPGVNFHRIAAKNAYDPSLIWRLLSLIRASKPDVIQTWILQADILGGIVALLSHTPWIIREPMAEKGYTSYWKTKLRFWLAQGADAVVANSIRGRQYWTSNSRNRRCMVIRNGITFDATASISEPSINDSPIADDCKIVLYVGRLEEFPKNLLTMLVALSKAMLAMPILAIFVGEGSSRAELEQKAHQLGISINVLFTGELSHDRVIALMKRANLFLFVSKYEGFPNVVIEAMRCGCPLIVSNIPEHREFLDNRSALLVDPDNVDEISRAIQDCLLHEAEAKDRAQVASRISSQWSMEKSAQQYEHLYRDITHMRPGLSVSKQGCPEQSVGSHS